MYRECGDAHVLQALGDVDNLAVLVIVAEACLHRHRRVDRFHHGFGDGHHLRDVVHDARACAFRGHLFHRTAEIDVDDVGVGSLSITRRFHHRFYGITEDLNTHWSFKLFEIKLFYAFHRVTDETISGDELRIDHVGTKQLADITERWVGDILHGGQQERIVVEFEVGKVVFHFKVVLTMAYSRWLMARYAFGGDCGSGPQ